MIGILMRTFTFLGKDIFLQLYKALIWLHIEYGNAIWHPYWNRQSAAFERVQRRATKLVPEIKDIPYIWRLSSLSLISLKAGRVRGDLIQSYKIINNVNDTKISKFLSCLVLHVPEIL